MKWLLIITLSVLLLTVPVIGITGVILYFIYASQQKTSKPEIPKTNPIQPRDWSNLNSGDLADLVLLRLELQRLSELELIDAEKQVEINAICDALCQRYLADLSAVQDNALWHKHRESAWDLLNNYADTPLGQPPWRAASRYPSFGR